MSEERVERIRYRFIGHVQSRGFRFACMMSARDAGTTGWVRNERDGTVTAEVQGGQMAQMRFLRRLTEVVTGFGNSWSVGTERSVPTVDEEHEFSVRRY